MLVNKAYMIIIKKEVYNMSRDKYNHYVNEKGVEIKASTSSSGKDKIDIYDSCPAENEDHGSIHINFDSDSGTGTITDTTSGSTETTNVGCYLTTACMRYMQENFDDNCYELKTLRWFRDSYVSKEDIKQYYEKAPAIVEVINKLSNNKDIYDKIYKNVILPCVQAIENKEYDFAYKKYKDSILALEKNLLL